MNENEKVTVTVAFIKESYFDKFAPMDSHIKLNHEADKHGKHDRPHLLLKLDENSKLYVCVPLSTKVDKEREYAARKQCEGQAKNLPTPTNYGVAFLMYNGIPNVALVNQVIPVTSDYVQFTVDASISKRSYDRIVAYAKDNLGYYNKREEKGFGWRGVITKYNEIKAELETELSKESVFRKKQIETPEIKMLMEAHKKQDNAAAPKQQEMEMSLDDEEPSIETYSRGRGEAQLMNDWKAEIGDIRSQLSTEQEQSHEEMENDKEESR